MRACSSLAQRCNTARMIFRPTPKHGPMRGSPSALYSRPMSDVSRIAALLGDPARANILTALLDGRALTAKELAFAAHVSPQTTSGHLGNLTDAQLLTVERQGRHRYYRLSNPLVGQMLESVMALAVS